MRIIDKIKGDKALLNRHREEGCLSTAGMFESFLTGTIRQDFQNEIDVQIEDVRWGLEDPESNLVGRDYDMLRGVLQGLRAAREIFIMMHENTKTDDGQKKEEK